MATDNNQQDQPTRLERFTAWNPYAAELASRVEDGTELLANEQLGALAIAFEVSQLRTEIHFAAKRGRS